MKQAAIYCRVSTDDQREAGTIESQVFAVREICERDNAKIIKEYVDDGWSGGTLNRPGLDELRDDAKRGIWDTLYIYDSSRLGRDHIDQGIILRELKKQGISVVFRDRPLTEENSLLTNIESIIGEYERKAITERTRRGKLHKIKQGKVQNCMPPFGYKRVQQDGEWKVAIDEQDSKVVQQIFSRYLECQNIRKIAEELMAQGIRNRESIRTKERHFFSSKRIREMLANESYIGNWYWYKRENTEPKRRIKKYNRLVKSSRRVKDRSEWICVSIPSIIEKEKFEYVRELRSKNFKRYCSTKHFWLLTGLVRCGRCKGRMQGCSNGKHFYYRCERINYSLNYRDICSPIPFVRRDQLEPLVWEKVKTLFQDPKMILKYASYLTENSRDRNLVLEEKEELIKELKKIEKKKEKFFDLYEEEGIDKKELLGRISGFGEEEKKIERGLKAIEVRLNQEAKKGQIIDNLEKFSKVVKRQFEIVTQEQQKEILQSVIKQIVYNPEERNIAIDGFIPVFDTTPEEWENMKEIPMVSLGVPSK